MKIFSQGFAISTVHTGVNKCISNEAIIENYKNGVSGLEAYYDCLKTLLPNNKNIPRPYKVTLNKNNIADVSKSIFYVYCHQNKDEDNPYCQLEISYEFGVLHDATTNFTKTVNALFVRVVNGDGEIFKVPFSFNKVPGSFTGEALRDELLKEISKIKQVKNNASNTIPAALIDHKKKKNIPEQDPKFQYKHTYTLLLKKQLHPWTLINLCL